MKARKKVGTEKGFTLIEIMVVIVIVGLLVTVVAPNVMGHLFKSQKEVAKMQVIEFDKVIEMFYINNRRQPESFEELIEADNEGQPYLKGITEVPLDPWDREYVILRGETPSDWEVVSYGPDMEEGTEDDISSKTAKDRERKD